MSLADNRQIVKAFLDGIAGGHISDTLVTPDFHAWTTASGAMPADRYLAGVTLLKKLFTKPLQMAIASMTAEEDRVVAEVESHGPLTSGEEYRNSYVFVFRVRDNRVASVAEHFNPFVVADKLVPLIRQLMAQAPQP